MYKSLSRLALAAAALGVAAPAAGADTVAGGDLRITNEHAAGKTSFEAQSWPTGTAGFIFVDSDRDKDADVTLMVHRDGTIDALRVSGSTFECQLFSGEEIAPTSDGGFRVDIPSSAVGADFNVMTILDGSGPQCGSSDDSSRGAAVPWDTTLTFTDATAPGAPAGLRAVAADGTVSLDWADNPEKDLVSYKVYRRAGNGAFSLVATTVASQLADGGLTNGTEYTYYVKAFDERNAGEESARVTAMPAAPKGDPTLTPTPTAPGAPTTDPVRPGGGTRPLPTPKTLRKCGWTKQAAKRPRVGHVTPRSVTLVLREAKKGRKHVVCRRRPGGKWHAVKTTTRARFTDKAVRPGKRYEYRLAVVNMKTQRLSGRSKALKVRVPRAKKAGR